MGLASSSPLKYGPEFFCSFDLNREMMVVLSVLLGYSCTSVRLAASKFPPTYSPILRSTLPTASRSSKSLEVL